MVLICAQSAEVVIPDIKRTHKFKLNVPFCDTVCNNCSCHMMTDKMFQSMLWGIKGRDKMHDFKRKYRG